MFAFYDYLTQVVGFGMTVGGGYAGYGQKADGFAPVPVDQLVDVATTVAVGGVAVLEVPKAAYTDAMRYEKGSQELQVKITQLLKQENE